MEQIPKADNPEALHQQLLRSFTEFELSFRRRFPVIWLTTLLAPFVISAGLIVFFGLTDGWGFSRKLVGHALMTFFVFGRLIILCGLESNADDTYRIALSPAVLFGLVTYLDFMVALFVTFHMGFLFRIPYVGPKVAMLVWDGRFILNAQPWVKRVAFLGLVIFVIFPTSTTGSIGGSIFGRLLGLSRYMIVLGILFGSMIGNAIMYIFAKQINQYITPDNVWIKVVGVLVLVGLFALVEIRYRFVKRKYMAAAKSRVEKLSEPQTADSDLTQTTDENLVNQEPRES